MKSVYYNSLGGNKRIYDTALQCLQSRGRSFPISSSIQANELYPTLLGDNPELFYVGQKFGIIVSLFQRSIVPSYLYSPSETADLRHQLDETVQRIIGENINDHQSDFDKIRSLHDHLKCNIEYDTPAMNSNALGDRKIAEAHNVIGALLKNKCVCEGFAKAFKLLCDKVGLECWFVSGTGSSSIFSGGHAWNIVKINGYYHHVDVTWDNQFSNQATVPNYSYMNLSDEEISKDHTWNRKHYPACPSSPYNYFRINNALLDSKSQLENFLYNSFQMEEEYITFRVVRGSILEQEIHSCLDGCIQRAANCCKHISVSSYERFWVQEQLVFSIKPDYIF